MLKKTSDLSLSQNTEVIVECQGLFYGKNSSDES